MFVKLMLHGGIVADQIDTLEQILLEKLQQKEYQPVELLQGLIKSGHGTSDLKLALAHLLHDGEVELTPNHTLRAHAALS
jgi:hypothetical protein